MKINNAEVAICFVSNLGYLPHFCAALASFVRNNPGSHQFFLFNEDVPDGDILKIQNWLFQKSPECTLTDMKLDTSVLPKFSGYWEKLGVQVFHRLLIPDELPNEFELALYLDSDIIVHDKIALDGFPYVAYTILAVKDGISHILAPKRGLKNYFNAGVMLINIKRWKNNQSVEKLLKHKPVKTLFAEQELLNEVFANDWFPIAKQCNFQAHKLLYAPFSYKINGKKKPVIIHFIGPIKPWLYWVRGSVLYWSYLITTPYKRQLIKAPLTILNSLGHLIKTRK